MALSTIDAKIKIKGSSVSGDTATLGPSGDHTDGTWTGATMVYDREFFFNTVDGRLWIGTNEIPMLFGTGGTSTTLALKMDGTTNSIPTFGNSTVSNGLHLTVVGGYYNNIGINGATVTAPAEGVPDYNIIGGGAGNDIVDSNTSFIGGGINNVISGSNRSTIVGGNDNDTAGFNNVHIIGTSITATKANATYVDSLMNEDSGIVLRKTIIDIGDWDMDATTTINVAHGLSATEWKTVRSMSGFIRNDADTVYYPITMANGNTFAADVGFGYIDSTNVNFTRLGGGAFDNTSYDQTSFNRGWVTLEYTPDV